MKCFGAKIWDKNASNVNILAKKRGENFEQKPTQLKNEERTLIHPLHPRARQNFAMRKLS